MAPARPGLIDRVDEQFSEKYNWGDPGSFTFSRTEDAAPAARRTEGPVFVASLYINHPIAVAAELAVEAGVSDLTALQAAIQHDTIERTPKPPMTSL